MGGGAFINFSAALSFSPKTKTLNRSLVNVERSGTEALVPHVRITKLHCYCKHSVLCIG